MKKHVWSIITIAFIGLTAQIMGFLWLYWQKTNFQKISNIYFLIAISLLTIKIIFYLIFTVSKSRLHHKTQTLNLVLTDQEIAKDYLGYHNNEDKYEKYLQQVKKLLNLTFFIAILNLAFAISISIIFSTI